MVAGSRGVKLTSPVWRALMVSAALAASVALTGCQTDGGVDLAGLAKAMRPR